MKDGAGLVDDLMGSAGVGAGSVVMPEDLAGGAGEAPRGSRLRGVNMGDQEPSFDLQPEA